MEHFVIRHVATGIKFDLHAPNGEMIASSEVYQTEAACRRGIESVHKNAPIAPIADLTIGESTTNPKFELYQDRSGGFRFRLRARNGGIIAVSESYTTKQACISGIRAVKSCTQSIIKEQPMKKVFTIILLLSVLCSLCACGQAEETKKPSRPTAATLPSTQGTSSDHVPVVPTSPTAPTVSIPNVSIPDVTLPDISVPDVSAPDFSMPDVTTPSVSGNASYGSTPGPSVPNSYFDAEAATPVIGAWYYTFTTTDAEQTMLGISKPISITLNLEFDNAGRLHAYPNETELLAAMDVLMESPTVRSYAQEYMVEYLYQTYADMGMNKEETESLIQSVFGMTIEEYALVMLDSTDYDILVEDLILDVDYYVAGSILYIGNAAANDWSICAFSATRDSLTILSVVLSDTLQAEMDAMMDQYEGQIPMDPDTMLSSMLPLTLLRQADQPNA